jgi:hypothetical protein
MSDNQLQKLREERDVVARELELLKKAMRPAEAAEKVTSHIKKAEDPLCLPADNEWASNSKEGGCCTIM